MKQRKIISLLFVLTLCISVISGCGTKQKTNIQSNEKNVKSFDLWVGIHPFTMKAYESHNEHPMAAKLAEKTGINVHYINPPVGQEKEQLNLILSSSNLPDAIWFDIPSFYRGGIEAAIDDGLFINSNELIEKYAPNFMNLINSDENVKRDSYTDEGIIKSLGAIIPDAEMRGLPFNGPIVNKEYLDSTGLSVPETITEWEQMLKQFKENGVKIPFSWAAKNKMDGLYDAFSGAYGVPSSSGAFYKENNIVKYGPIQEGYKQFLTLMNRWYEEGLLDPDYLTRDFNKHIKPKLTTGEIGATVGHSTYLQTIKDLAASQNKKIKLMAVPYPVLNKGEKLHFRQHVFNVEPTGIHITTQAKDPETIVKWVDYLYSEEGQELIVWGEEGITFKYNEKGEKVYTDLIENNPDGLTISYTRRQILFHDITPVWDWDEQKLFYNTPEKLHALDVWQKYDYKNTLPDSLILKVDESEQYVPIMSDIDTYVAETVSKFIMGIEPLDKFNEFVQNVNKMGIDKAINCQQNAYNRYLER